jgi:hypothetical protein
MKLNKDPFPANMNMVELEGKKVLIRPSQAKMTKGKEVIIGEERMPRMIKPKSMKDGEWQKNEVGKPQRCPNATFDILMAKYKEDKAGIRGCKNRTIQNPKLDSLISLSQANTSAAAARLANDLGPNSSKIQKAGIIITKIIIWRLTFRSGHQCLGCGDLHR